MSAGDRIAFLLVLLVLLAVYLFWTGHPAWACAALAPVLIVVAGVVWSVSRDPVDRRRRKTRESLARLAEIGLRPAPSSQEIAEAKALAESLCGEPAGDLSEETSPELVQALKNRGAARSSVLRVVSRMSGHRGTPEAVAAVQPGAEGFGPSDFVSLIRLHHRSNDPAAAFALARRIVAETPAALRAEVFPFLILIVPPPQEDWVSLLRPHRSEFLSGLPLPGADGEWQANLLSWWRDALDRDAPPPAGS
jgi:hypothetical protein